MGSGFTYNKVILAGNLVKDPKVTTTTSGAKVANFSIALNRNYKTKTEGKIASEVTFVDIEAWAKQCEIVERFCKKGSGIHIEGRLKQNSWTGEDGKKKSRIVVAAERVNLLGTKPGATGEEVEKEDGSKEDAPF